MSRRWSAATLNCCKRASPRRWPLLPAPHEGLNLLGTPERGAGRPGWRSFRLRQRGGHNPAPSAAGGDAAGPLPLWMEAAIRLGTRFWRIAAAGAPPGGAEFAPRRAGWLPADCVTCCEECGCEHPPHLDEYYFWLVAGAVYEPATDDAGARSAFTRLAATTRTATRTTSTIRCSRPRRSGRIRRSCRSCLRGNPRRPCASPGAASTTASSSSRGARSSLCASTRTAAAQRSELPRPDRRFADLLGDQRRHAAGATPIRRRPASATTSRPTTPSCCRRSLARRTPPTFLGTLNCRPTRTSCSSRRARTLLSAVAVQPVAGGRARAAIALPLRGRARVVPARLRSAAAGLHLDRYAHGKDSADRACGGRTSGCRAPAATAPTSPATQARDRAVLLHYLETLVEWGDALRRRGNSPEAFQQARVIFDAAGRILGRPPRPVQARAAGHAADRRRPSRPAFAPLNPRLLDLYETVGDRLALIRACQSAPALPDRRRRRETPYFGDDPAARGLARRLSTPAPTTSDWCRSAQPLPLRCPDPEGAGLRRARRAIRRRVARRLRERRRRIPASLRAGQEREMLTLGLAAQEDRGATPTGRSRRCRRPRRSARPTSTTTRA